MSEMTLEEAMRVLETATIYARGAEASRAYATVRAHAERTVEARSDEPEAVKRLREAPVWHLVTDYIDTITAERDRLAACVERVESLVNDHGWSRGLGADDVVTISTPDALVLTHALTTLLDEARARRAALEDK